MPNRLAQANSLYLRKHADNPIDWWPWCDEALATAREQNKPIFLSIGYSSCHWCTVMEGEAFSDRAIAEYMNAYFLPIKVDREERPDIDSIYMQALQMMVGQGGWPLNVFLTPDSRVPFYGGTYFSVQPRYGQPGFLQVLQAVRNYYDHQKEKLQAIQTEILQNLQQSAHLSGSDSLSPDLLQKGLAASVGVLASRGPGTRFPMIPYGDAALHGVRFHQEAAREATAQRGMDLALGGIFDQVAGGFHRYTVDPTWTVPHFEKMLYDNGQIVEYLANLWANGQQEPAFERAIARTVEWLQREMTAPEGYFYAAQDADSFVSATSTEPEEGAFYVWPYAEFSRYLSAAQLGELTQHFDVSEQGNFEGTTVLQRHQPGVLPDSVEATLDQLFEARYGAPRAAIGQYPPACDNQAARSSAWPGRIPPVTDTKMIVAWNSLMMSGLARAAVVLGQPTYLDRAIAAADFILQYQWLGDRLHRVNYAGTPSVIAQSEDYAFFIKALLDIHQACLGFAPPRPGTTHWLEQAVRVQTELDTYLWDRVAGGYFNTDDRADLLLRERSYTDNATPSANGVAITNLVRLALLTEDLTYLDRAEHTLKAFAPAMAQAPQLCPSLLVGLDWFYHPTLIRSTPAVARSLVSRYLPTAVITLEPNLPTGAIALVCQGLSCQEPATSPEQLEQQLQASLAVSS